MEAWWVGVSIAPTTSLTVVGSQKREPHGPRFCFRARQRDCQCLSSAKMSLSLFSGTSIEPMMTVISAIVIGYHNPK